MACFGRFIPRLRSPSGGANKWRNYSFPNQIRARENVNKNQVFVIYITTFPRTMFRRSVKIWQFPDWSHSWSLRFISYHSLSSWVATFQILISECAKNPPHKRAEQRIYIHEKAMVMRIGGKWKFPFSFSLIFFCCKLSGANVSPSRKLAMIKGSSAEFYVLKCN